MGIIAALRVHERCRTRGLRISWFIKFSAALTLKRDLAMRRGAM